MVKENPGYYSVTPAAVRYCKKLPAGARLLYGEISALTTREGYCWATNRYFAELYEVGLNTVSEWIGGLVDEGFISTEVDAAGRRRIYLTEALTPPEKTGGGSRKTGGDPPEKTVGHLNTTENTTRKKTFGEESPEVLASRSLFVLIKRNDPNAKEPDFQKWAVHIDLIRRVDKRPDAELAAVIRFCQADPFWRTNILSTKKLREKFPQLLLKMKATNGNRAGSGYKGFDPKKFEDFVQGG